MKNRFLLSAFVLLLLSLTVSSQTFEEKYAEAGKTDNAKLQMKILVEWEKAEPENPEFYVAAFNYHLSKAREEVLNTGREMDGRPVLELKDSKTGETAGFISSQLVYEPKSLNMALEYLRKGISKFPDRLDMRFGEIYVLKEQGDFAKVTALIISAVEQSSKNRNRWVWMKGEKVDDPKEFLLGNIQSYVGNLFDAGLDNAVFIKQIAEAVLKHYPDDVRYLSNLSVFHMIEKQWDEALVPLLKAEKIAPEDPIILGNIAYNYFEKGDKPNAVIYYRRFYKYGNDDAKSQARAQLRKLGAKP